MLASFRPQYSRLEIRKISIQATLTAFAVLFVLVSGGNFILRTVFHVEIYSLQIVGGFVLLLIGMSAVTRGRFYRKVPVKDRMQISVVPMTMPLIVGPGTVVAAITFSSDIGFSRTMLALFIALSANCCIMLCSVQLGRLFEKFHLTEILIRVTGFVVASVAVQLILNAIYIWAKSITSGKI